eukprot:19182-Pelagococcus_subviridis.AAC.4
MDTMPTRKITIMHELNMLNQWMWCSKKSFPRGHRHGVLRDEVHLRDPPVVVLDLELLVRVDLRRARDLALAVSFRVLPDEAPDGKVVHHELVPVVLARRARERRGLAVRQRRDLAHGRPRDVLPELELHVALHELVPLQDLTQAAPLVLRRGVHATERQAVVVVRLLR